VVLHWHCTVLYCTVLYCTVLFCTVLYCTALHYTALLCDCDRNNCSRSSDDDVDDSVIYCRLLMPLGTTTSHEMTSAIYELCCTVQHSAVQYSAVQCRVLQCHKMYILIVLFYITIILYVMLCRRISYRTM
jgi:hypothetical protein